MSNSNGTESVKLKVTTVTKVRKHKEKTGIPITVFIEAAIDEKLKKTNQKV